MTSLLDQLGPLKPAAASVKRHAGDALLRLQAGVFRHGLVLMYHRVAAPETDPWDMSVSPAHFAEHLDVLKRYGACTSLPTLVDQRISPDRPRRRIAITFDDGYRDNAVNAAPGLEAHDLPATMFVVSGIVGRSREFWWDALARVFLVTSNLPEELRLTARGEEHVWTLGAASACTPVELQGFAHWSADRHAVSHPRQAVFLAVWGVLNAGSLAEADALCETVLAWAGVDADGPPRDHPMTAEDVSRLAAGGLIEIGGHTVTHQGLDAADRDRAIGEISGCRRQLREIAGREITSFSYPFGRFGPATPDLVREAGFHRACNSRQRLVLSGADPFLIPRISVSNMDGSQFERFLEKVTGA